MTLGRWIGMAIVLVAGSACGGNGNPNFDAVSHQFYTAYCVRLHSCLLEKMDADAASATWLKAYPLGQSDCVDQNFKEFSSLSSLSSECSQEQWDTCTKDMETTTCVPVMADGGIVSWGPKIPDSCRGC